MSVFSRLFQKNQEAGEQDPAKKSIAPAVPSQEEPAQAKVPAQTSAAPTAAAAAAAARGSMRPKAPAFQIPPEALARTPVPAQAEPAPRAPSAHKPPEEPRPNA